MNPYLRAVLSATAFAALPVAAQADVFRCIGADGKTLYSDSPCPQGVVQKSNITEAVGACNTAECEAKHQQMSNDARDRLRAEKVELADLTQKRMERERVSFEEQRWRQSMESQMAAEANAAAQAASDPVYYPAYPLTAGRGHCGPNCLRPNPRPHDPRSHDGKLPVMSHPKTPPSRAER